MTAPPEPQGHIKIIAADFLTGAASAVQFPRQTHPEVSVLGRSNVGKSSLLNFISGRKNLARVSNTPGRTREINFFKIVMQAGVDKKTITLVDLPGYGWAEMSKASKDLMAKMIREYVETGRASAGCLLFDVRREPNDEDFRAWDAIRNSGSEPIAVVTKSDKLSKSARGLRKSEIGKHLGLSAHDVVMTSVDEQLGREDLLKRLWRVTAVEKTA